MFAIHQGADLDFGTFLKGKEEGRLVVVIKVGG